MHSCNAPLHGLINSLSIGASSFVTFGVGVQGQRVGGKEKSSYLVVFFSVPQLCKNNNLCLFLALGVPRLCSWTRNHHKAIQAQRRQSAANIVILIVRRILSTNDH